MQRDTDTSSVNDRPLRIGVLMHGRHLQAAGWRNMMWGYPEQNLLGSVPTAMLVMLNVGPENIAVVTMGTGASFQLDGTSEAMVTKQFWLESFDRLDVFTAIASHPLWATHKEVLRRLVAHAVVDETSHKTIEEIAHAAKLFHKQAIHTVIEVTSASHAPRCQLIQSMARADRTIPADQLWQLVADDIPYAGTKVEDMLIFEEPHRADDPMHAVPEQLRPTHVFRNFFALSFDARIELLRLVADFTRTSNDRRIGH